MPKNALTFSFTILALAACGGSSGSMIVPATEIAVAVPPAPPATESEPQPDTEPDPQPDTTSASDGHDHRPNIVNVPSPFARLSPSWDRNAENTSVQGQVSVKTANNLNGAFRVRCGVSYYVRTDPLLNRNDSHHMSHMHTYFGGDVPTDDKTDLDDLTAQGVGSTCAGGKVNRSLYWIPTMLRAEGDGEHTVVEPTNFFAYYKNSLNVYGKTESVIFNRNKGVSDTALIARALPSALPDGWRQLKMISHSYENHPNVEKGNSSQWSCSNTSGGTSTTTNVMPLDCAPNSTLRIQMWFPQCLNTKKQPLGPADSTNPAKYSAEGQLEWLQFAKNRVNDDGCPSDTADDTWVRIPTLSYAIYYKVDATGNANWVLSSDHMMGDGRPGNSMHGDFMNGWAPEAASAWYEDCLLNNKSCTNFYDDLGGNRWIRLFGEQSTLFTNQ
ncbi:MAG: DUF1996 domain-containing protein [Pseudomonadota bacterium]